MTRLLARLSGLCLLLSAPALAQETAPAYVSEGWTIGDGLPVNAVTDVEQTYDGYLWLATFDGLVRFDGVRFTVFNIGNTDALPSSRILELVETRDSSLWIRTAQEHLVRYRHPVFENFGPAHGLDSRAITVLYEDPGGTFYVGTDRGLRRYRDGRLVAVPLGDGPVRVTALRTDRTGILWVGTDRGAWRLPPGGPAAPPDETDPVTALCEDAEGAVWIATPRGVDRFVGGERTHTGGHAPREAFHLSSHNDSGPLAFAPDGVFQYRADAWHRLDWAVPPRYAFDPVQVDAHGNRWIAAGPDLYRDGIRIFRAPSTIRSLVHDHEGSIWLATSRSGLYRLKRASFQVYGEPEGLRYPIVYVLCERRAGALWIGTTHGLARLAGGVVQNVGLDGLADRFVRSLYEDRDGTLWVGTLNGVSRLVGDRFVPFGREHGLSDGVQVHAIYESSAGEHWFGTAHGLFRVRGDTWDHFTTRDGLSHDYIRYILEARDGTLWFATNGGGLTTYREGRFRRLTAADGLSSDLVRSIYEDADGVLWVGTEGRGLNRLDLRDPDAPRITRYRKADGLFDEVIHMILEDDDGRLWMSTNRGIFWSRRDDLNAFAAGAVTKVHATAYTERDGLRHREANGGMQPAGIRTRDGRLWFATQSGAVVVDPSAIRPNPLPPPLVIEQVVARDTAFLAAGPVALSAAERAFEVQYTGLSFLAPENMRFRYRLEGFDRDWVEVGTRRVAYYTNVPPGRYVFRLQASNNDGAWNEQDATLPLSIAPFFYEATWFLALCALVAAGLGLGGIGLRVRRQRRREQELERLVASRTEALVEEQERTAAALTTVAAQAEKLKSLDAAKSRVFANVSHEFRTPLTLLIGPLESALAGAYGPVGEALRVQHRMMLRNSRRLLRLINQILDLARLEADQFQLDAQTGDLVPFVRRTVQAFAPLAERQQLALTCESAVARCVARFDPDALEKVLLNLLSNAIKFTGPGGNVGVSLRAVDGHAEVAVADSGVGIPAEALPHVFDRFFQVDGSSTRRREGTGIGLALAKELIELHGGAIHVESIPGAGTTFTVRLPLPTGATAWTASGGDGEVTPPLPDAGTERAAPPASRTTPSHADDRTTVLVVEDNADVRAYLRSILEAEFRMLEAPDGAEGLAQARAALPDLILADVMMPKLDGFALNRALKDDPALDCIPVVLLTARAALDDQVEGLATGADDYVTKPFEPEVLRAKVRNLIALRLRLRERVREELSRAPGLPAVAHGFEAEVRRVVEAHLTDPDFTVERLADAMALSYVQLYRRLRDEGAPAPAELIRTVRLEHAARLLLRRVGSISEVAYAVGFNSIAHFSRSFRAHYGQAPSEYAAKTAG